MTGKQRIPRLRLWGTTKFKQTILMVSAVLLAVGLNLLPTLSNKAVYADSGSGQITGTVKETNGTPISGATVKAFVSAQAYYEGQVAANTTSAADGTYSLTGLADGSYVVLFNDYSDPGSNHAWSWQFYNTTTRIPEQANQVTVSGGGTTSDIDGYLLPAGQISGTVTNKQGQPLGGIKVGAYGANEDFGNNVELPITTTTASDGTYTLPGAAAGVYDYFVVFNMNNTAGYTQLWYDNTTDVGQAAGVSITASQTHTGIDARLFKVGKVSGHLTDQFGRSLSGITVALFAQGKDYGQGPDYTVNTDMQGNYAFEGIPEGSWLLDANDRNFAAYNQDYASLWYNGRDQMSTADPIVVVGGDNVVASMHLNRLIPTLTFLASSRNSIHAGQRVTLTAWAIPVNHGGMMTFMMDGHLLEGCGFVQFSGMAATCATTFTTAGAHSITAVWGGDSTFKASTSNTITVRVIERQ